MHSETDIIRLDVSAAIGFPMVIELHGITSSHPLFWRSLSGESVVEEGKFLESPGLPLAHLLPQQLHMLPQQLLSLVMILPEYQFQILQAMLLSQESLELALSNKWLFLLLILYAQEQLLDEQQFQAIVQEKRKKILQHIGCTASKGMLRLLSRLPFKLNSRFELFTLLQVLSEPRLAEMMVHQAQPCMSHILLLGRSNEYKWPAMLNMVNQHSTHAEFKNITGLISDCEQMGVTHQQLHSVVNIQQLQALHDRLVEQQNQQATSLLANKYQAAYGDFPCAPLPGNDVVVPLTSWAELVLEGKKMHHCVGSYHQQVAIGDKFIYRIETTQRLTLSIRKTLGGWMIDELKAVCNAAPSIASQKLVQSWFEQAIRIDKSQTRFQHPSNGTSDFFMGRMLK